MPAHCDFTASLHKSTVSLLCPPVTIGSAEGDAGELGLAADVAPVAGFSPVVVFLSHPVIAKARPHRPVLSHGVTGLGLCFALEGGKIGEVDSVPDRSRQFFRKSQQSVRTPEKRKRARCITLL
jgi:hypothetical protein